MSEQKKTDTPLKPMHSIEPTGFEKVQAFVKKNKGKIIAVITVAVSALAGDSVGVFDFVKAWFGF